MKAVKLRNSLVILLLVIFISGLASFITACEPDLSFGDLTICENVNEETFEPINRKNEFDINIGKIYATIEYSGAKGEDNYRFNWSNLDTGENILDESSKYSEGKANYFEGYAMSYIATNKEAKVIPLGNYKVDFYHNGELKSTANFVIKGSEIEILEVALANEVDENSSPVNETQQFLSSEVIYACVNLNSYISGNSIMAKWYDNNGELIMETIDDLDVNVYEPAWIAFTLEGEGRDIPAGTYNVEIYLNNDLHGTYDFEVVEERQAIAGDDNFTQGNIYSNDKYGVSFSVPDDWTYTESEDAEGLEVNLVSQSIDLPLGFLFMASPSGDYPSSDQYSDLADEMSSDIAADNNWEVLDVQENEFTNGNDITFHDFVYTYKDQDNKDWATAIAFAEGSSRLYVVFATVRSDYFSMGESIYMGITGTMELQ